jgi:hypothetical protein
MILKYIYFWRCCDVLFATHYVFIPYEYSINVLCIFLNFRLVLSLLRAYGLFPSKINDFWKSESFKHLLGLSRL